MKLKVVLVVLTVVLTVRALPAQDPESAKAHNPPADAPLPVATSPQRDLEAEKATQAPSPDVPGQAVVFRDLEAEKSSRAVLRHDSLPSAPSRDLEAEKARRSGVERAVSPAEIDPATADAYRQAVAAIPLVRGGNGPRILPFLAQDGSFIAIEKPILAFQIMPSSDLFGNVTVIPLEKNGRMILPFPDPDGKEIAIERRSEKSQPR